MSGRPHATPRTVYLLKAAELAVRIVADPELQKFGLTMAQYMILSLVSARGNLSSADLARRLSVTPQSINEFVVRLEKQSLISRQEDSSNRRILRLSITTQGREMLARCDQVVDAVERRLLAGHGQAELNALRGMLSTIAAHARTGSEL